MRRGRTRAAVAALLAMLAAGTAPPRALAAGPAAAPRLRPLVGEERHVFLESEETLLDVAARNHLGFEAVARLNPDVDVWLAAPGTVVRLPTRMILPDAPEQGIVVNLPEMRLYDYTVPDGPAVLAVAVGDASDPTPIGRYRIGAKRIDPTWNVPRSIREERPELPAQVPPGPDNPLGSRWMTVGDTSYGIHGTNVRWSIGREATHGCIRLYESDMQALFDRTPEGTRLALVYQPYKWGIDGDRLYLEVHPDLYDRRPDRLAAALAVPRALGLLGDVRLEAVWRAVDEAKGVPVWVGSVTPSRARELAGDPP